MRSEAARGFLAPWRWLPWWRCSWPGSAAAAGNKKLVEGTVLRHDLRRTCVRPNARRRRTAGRSPRRDERGDRLPAGASAIIACPLSRASAIVCVQAEGCPGTSRLPGLVRRRGGGQRPQARLGAALATLPVVEGHFTIRLAPGEYVLRPYLPEPQCWSGEPTHRLGHREAKGPIPALARRRRQLRRPPGRREVGRGARARARCRRRACARGPCRWARLRGRACRGRTRRRSRRPPRRGRRRS